MFDQNCLIWVFLGQTFQETIVIFEVSTIFEVKNEFLTHTVNFGIRQIRTHYNQSTLQSFINM